MRPVRVLTEHTAVDEKAVLPVAEKSGERPMWISPRGTR
jgi:hypothetical protein